MITELSLLAIAATIWLVVRYVRWLHGGIIHRRTQPDEDPDLQAELDDAANRLLAVGMPPTGINTALLAFMTRYHGVVAFPVEASPAWEEYVHQPGSK